MRRSSFPSTSCVAVLAAVLSAPSQSIRAVQFLLAVKSVLQEVEDLNRLQGYKGVISDLGGPTANMYRMRCTRPEIEAAAAAHPVFIRPSAGAGYRPWSGEAVDKRYETRMEEDGARRFRSPYGSGQSRSGIHRRSGCSIMSEDISKVAPEHIDDDTLKR